MTSILIPQFDHRSPEHSMDQFFDEDANRKSAVVTPGGAGSTIDESSSQASSVGLQQSLLKLEDAMAATGRSQALLELRLLKTARTLQEKVAQRAIEMARLNIDTATDVARATITAEMSMLREDLAHELSKSTLSIRIQIRRLWAVIALLGCLLLILSLAFIASR